MRKVIVEVCGDPRIAEALKTSMEQMQAEGWRLNLKDVVEAGGLAFFPMERYET